MIKHLAGIRTSLCPLILGLLLVQPGKADIVLTEGIQSNGWPEALTIETADPAQMTTVINATPTVRVGQTLTATSDFYLESVYVYYATSSVVAGLTVRIQEVAEGNPSETYQQGANLLSFSGAFSLASTGGQTRFLKLTFTGNDRIQLLNGKVYAVEFSTGSGTLALYRRGASTYAGGAVFANRLAFSYPSTRDIAIGLVQAPPPGSGTLIQLSSLTEDLLPFLGTWAPGIGSVRGGFKQ